MLEKDIKDIDANIPLLKKRQGKVKRQGMITMSVGILYMTLGMLTYYFYAPILGCIVCSTGFTITILGAIVVTFHNYYNIMIVLKQNREVK